MQKALLDQSKLLMNPSPAFYNLPSIELASRLTGASVFDRVFFANSGGERTNAIKLARKWGQVNKKGAYKIITMNHGFHGRTLATMSASGKPGWDKMFAPQVEGFPKAEINDLESVRKLIDDQTVAIMLEPVQGEAGVIPPPRNSCRACASWPTSTSCSSLSTKCRPAWAAPGRCSLTSNRT